MKKIASLLVTVGLVLGSVAGASAIEFKAGGSFEMGYYWADHSRFNDLPQDKFGAATRIHLRFDAIANENLRGVYQARIGTTSWGVNNGNGTGPQSGYGIGTQGVNVRTLDAYLNFRWPGTNLKLRMGLFPTGNPQAVRGKYSGGLVLEERVAGLEAAYEFNKNVSVVATWSRLANQGDGVIGSSGARHSKMDIIMLAVPVTTDVINVTPWGMYGMAGENAEYHVGSADNYNIYLDNSSMYLPTEPDTRNAVNGKDGKLWWAGLAVDVTALENWILKADAIYGRYKADYTNRASNTSYISRSMIGKTGDPKREGWMFDLQVGYKLEHFTPTMIAFYSTGDDYSDWKNNESGRLPILTNLHGWTSLGSFNNIAANSDGIDRKLMNAQGYTGMWGIMLGLEDIKFIDKLTSAFRVLYMRGTNDDDILKAYRKTGKNVSPWYLGTSDSAWEFNFDHEYKLYENLGFWVQLGYIILDRDHDNEPLNSKYQSKNAASVFTGFYYKF